MSHANKHQMLKRSIGVSLGDNALADANNMNVTSGSMDWNVILLRKCSVLCEIVPFRREVH